MYALAKYMARCRQQNTRSEIQETGGSIAESHGSCEMRNLLDITSQGRQMQKSGGNGYCVHFLHQAAESFFVPEDIGEIR